ncbi:MAG: dihydropteroate synthase [Longimicrobiales bacterium]
MVAGRRAGQGEAALLGNPPTAPHASTVWRTERGPLDLDRPRIAGILNATPDSFFDGGRHQGVDRGLARAEAMLEQGADLLDLGGESTRPGARPVALEQELERILPLLREFVRRWPTVPVSIDTVKSGVARAALAEGAAAINDVSGLRLDPALGEAVAEAGAGLVLMHSRGDVARMASYDDAVYGDDPVAEIVAELDTALARARGAGVDATSIVLDPGLGFSKRTAHSVAVLAHLDRLATLGRPILVGPSRKRFIGELGGGATPDDRLAGTIAACVLALAGGARLFRVHDVGETRRALDVAAGILEAR